MAIQALHSEAVFNDKMLEHIEGLQCSDNSELQDYISCCEEIGNLLLDIGTGCISSIEPEEVLRLLSSNNQLRQMLNDFKAPDNHGRK